MSVRVSVGTSFGDAALIVLGFAAGVFAAIAVPVTVLVGPLPAALPGVPALLALVGFLLRYRYIARNRRWVTPTDDGFVLEDRRGTFEFTDNMVSDLAAWTKVRYHNGSPKARVRTGAFVLNVGELAGDFRFQYEFSLKADDPLGEMIERVFHKVFDRAKAEIAAGNPVAGEGWEFDRDGLHVTTVGREESFPLAAVTAVDVVDKKVVVWVARRAEPSVRVPAGSRNALVLHKLLNDDLTANPRPSADEESAGGLGRVIFERDKSIDTVTLVVGAVLAMVVPLIAIGLLLLGLNDPQGIPAKLVIIGLAFVIAPPIMWVAAWFARVNVFRCHSLGVFHHTPRGEKWLKFQDIGTFTYKGTRNYTNGAYTGTTINMTFEPHDDVDAVRIHYSTNFKNADEELDNLRDFISRVIAGHMLNRLKKRKSVIWTSKMRFTDEGIEATKSGWLKSGGVHLIPYGEIGDYRIDDGVFYLGVRGEKKWAVSEPVSQPNFFPGFVLMLMILNSPKGDAADA
ncbi:hypothetical protein [Fimbriiglobus ruber]|uniref:Uncharacterized protein n=1 Tax=Fimbriiglobus ruber TaxID=1908690 RepID=A0A225DUZ7_9BACT|nr:hypothetical protein [Fimbriiglobus ruber]OWK42348.1 hypothetical protein FRUB_04426 [Fimbriiglobus ruber]